MFFCISSAVARPSLFVLADLFEMLGGINRKSSLLDDFGLYTVELKASSSTNINGGNGGTPPLAFEAACKATLLCEVRRRKDYVRKTPTASCTNRNNLGASLVSPDTGAADPDHNEDSEFEAEVELSEDVANALGMAIAVAGDDGNEGNEDTVDSFGLNNGAELDELVDDDDIAELCEAERLNSRIAESASSTSLQRSVPSNQPTTGLAGLTNLDAELQHSTEASASRTFMMNANELEEEAWLHRSMMQSGMTTATVTIHEHRQQTQDDDKKSCSHQQVQVGFDKWKESVGLTVQALKSRHSSLLDDSLGKDNNISLLLRPDFTSDVCTFQVAFVQWSNTKKLLGRHLNIDSEGGVVCPIYFIQSAQSWAGSEVIHPAIGTVVRKVKKNQRPRISKEIDRLFHIYNVSLNVSSSSDDNDGNGSLDLDSALSGECCACGEDSHFQCGCCLCFWHAECATTASHIATSAHLNTYGLDAMHLPNVWLHRAVDRVALPAGTTEHMHSTKKKLEFNLSIMV